MKTKLWSGILVGGLFLAAGQLAISVGDDGEGTAKGGLAPVANALYAKECGSCHFAYQPGLLPAASWKKIVGGLSDHFGDNAELAPQDQKEIAAYLETNAADRAANERSAKVMRSLGGKEPPTRITEVPYIQRKHQEIPARLIRDNPEVKGLSHCSACHTKADRGIYHESSVIIPGYGRWDD
ncbi:MAG TPA: diheme cytochrome c [Candidatus Manganitrophaceae bacterium]